MTTDSKDPSIVITDLDELLLTTDLDSLGSRDLVELREIRDRLNEIENGLSFGRRLAQGRLDILIEELSLSAAGNLGTSRDLVGRLAEVLSRQPRGSSAARPVRDFDLPVFADTLVQHLDDLLSPNDMVDIASIDIEELKRKADEISAYERALSVKRQEVHRLIDEIQEEIIGRYRSGSASVDDLLGS
jgi:hypothetical protein